MNELQQYTNGQFELEISPHPVEGFRVQAPGLARALSISDAYTMLRSIPDAEKGSALVRTLGGNQNVGYVTEAGFYRALGMRQTGRIHDDMIRGRVESFQNWVYRDVLPSIRATGGYEAPAPVEFDPASLSRMDILRMAMEAEEQLQIAAPKAAAFDKFMDADGLYSMEATAKAIGYGRNVMFRELRRIGILQGNNLPYQRYMHHFEIKVGTRRNRDGETIPTHTTMVRPSGVEFIGKKLAQAVQAVEEAGVLA